MKFVRRIVALQLVRRSNGSTYRITSILVNGRNAGTSNDAICEQGWTSVDERQPVLLKRARPQLA
jgi:hypothetical protein